MPKYQRRELKGRSDDSVTYYAVIDTNVLLSALLSKNSDSATVQVIRAVLDGRIVPLYHDDIIQEYDDVLHRKKFNLHDNLLKNIIR